MELNQLCPNCGADMQMQGFVFVCDFCGTRVSADGFTAMLSQQDSQEEITKRFNYISKNKSYINSSDRIQLEDTNNEFVLTSSPHYYANNGKYTKITDTSIFYTLENNGTDESLLMAIATQKFSSCPQLSILLDTEIILTPMFEKWDGAIAYFKIDVLELKGICDSHTIRVSSDLLDNESAIYEELIPYTCRFYHYCFDKRKYIYSIHRKLISD